MEDKAVHQATERLMEAIRNSDAYQGYQQLRHAVMVEDTNRALLGEYQKLQVSLQMAAIGGQEADPQTVEQFSRLSALLAMNDQVSQYLLAQVRLQKLTGEVFQRVTDAAGLDFGLPSL